MSVLNENEHQGTTIGNIHIQERLNAVVGRISNKGCADCNALYPTWASLLAPVSEGDERMGVLCCSQCYSYHVELGIDVCVVKNLTVASDWTDADVKVLEQTGNSAVNYVYEATLKVTEESERNEISRRKEEDMMGFVQDKYQRRLYFSARMQEHIFCRRSRQRTRTKGLKSKSPCPGRSRRAVPTRVAPIDDGELCDGDGAATMEETRPSLEESGCRRDGLEKAHSDRHAGASARGGSRGPPRKMYSDVANASSMAIPKGSNHGRARRSRSPKMQRTTSPMSRRTCGLKRSSSPGYVSKVSRTDSAEKLGSPDHDGGGEVERRDNSNTSESAVTTGQGLPSSSGHGERRGRRKVERTRAVSSSRGQGPKVLSEKTSGRYKSSKQTSPAVNSNQEITSCSGHREKSPKRKVDRAPPGTKEDTKPEDDLDGGLDSASQHSSKSTSESSKENKNSSGSAHAERRARKHTIQRTSSGGPRRRRPRGLSEEPLKRKSSGSSEALSRTNSGSQRRRRPRGHSEEPRKRTSSGRASGTFSRTSSGGQRRRKPLDQSEEPLKRTSSEGQGSLGRTNSGRRRRSEQAKEQQPLSDQPFDGEEVQKRSNRPGMGQRTMSCRHLMENYQPDLPRPRRRQVGRRNSLEHKNVPVEVRSDCMLSPEELMVVSQEEEKPSLEDLGEDLELDEDEAKKKKKTWRKKLVKLAKGSHKNKGDKVAVVTDDTPSLQLPPTTAQPKQAQTFGAKGA